MAINLNDNISVLGAKPTDARYLDNLTPYASCGAVTTALAANKRYTGLTVNILGEEYWFAEGIENNDLVAKESSIVTTALTGATNGLTKVGQEVVLGGTLTGATTILGDTKALSLGSAASKLAAFQINAATVSVCSDGIAGINAAGGILTLDSNTCVSVNAIAKYDANCASEYDLRSIPDVAYVTGLTSQAILTASNGLTKDGNDNVVLGGDLTQNTHIGGAFTLGIHNQKLNITGDTCVNLGGPVILATTPGTVVGDILTYNSTTCAIAKNTTTGLGLITGAINGIGTTGQDVCLGGTLVANTSITGAYIMAVCDTNGVCLSTLNTNDIALNAKSNGAIIIKAQCGIVDSSTDTADAVMITMDANASTPMLVTDNSTGQFGMQYATDYSTNFCDNSLVSKYYVDTIATGLNVHGAVAVATTGATVLSGLIIVDGVQLVDADRVLVKDQADAKTNGIYAASATTWGRTEDYNFEPTGEIANGDLIPVTNGETNANSQWINVSDNPIVSGVTDITFSLFSQQQGVSAGDGISVTTVGTNREVAVELAAGSCGLTLASTSLALDFTIFGSGLTNTSGVVSVNASTCGAPIGTEIPVIFNASCQLIVDSDDFSYTTASNGLHKDGCNVVLGGVMTGSCAITMCGVTGLAFTDTRSATIGLQYSGVYKDGFTIHSIPDVDFVTGLTSGGIITANNGLTKVGQNVALGGTLTGDTLINGNGNNHCLSLNSLSCLFLSASDICLHGPTDMSSTLNVTSATTITSLTASGAIDANSTLNVAGATELQGTLAVTGETSLTAVASYLSDLSPFTALQIPDAQWVTGNTCVGTVTSVAALTITTTGTDITSSVADSTTTPVISLCIPTASAANRGALSSTDWTTFNDKTTCVGTVTSVGTTAPLTGTVTTSGSIGITQATTTTDGYLSSTDWDTFNAKTTCTGTITGGINGLGSSGANVCLGGALANDTTISGAFTLNVSGLTAFNACATNITLSGATAVGGTLTLNSVGAGDVGTDNVMLITTAGVVTKVAASTLGEDNNSYVTSGVSANVTLDDTYFAVLADSTGGAFTISLPAAPATGQAYKIKDSGLDALTNNITINGDGGTGHQIDGASTVTINTDGGALEVVWDGTTWNVMSFVN